MRRLVGSVKVPKEVLIECLKDTLERVRSYGGQAVECRLCQQGLRADIVLTGDLAAELLIKIELGKIT